MNILKALGWAISILQWHLRKCQLQEAKQQPASVPSVVELRYLFDLELVSKALNHLLAILHVYVGGLIFMK